MLILSEFAGAAQELFSALTVNPYDTQSLADALKHALSMPEQERADRMAPMRARVREMDAGRWARTFIEELAQTPGADEPIEDAGAVLNELVKAVKAGQRVALFLDYDGTLREIERTPEAAAPTPQLLALLQRLNDRTDLRTTIVSGRSADELSDFLGNFDRFTLVAEHGARVRVAGAWEDRTERLDFAWKEQVHKILALHAAATPGSFVEEKRTSLVWHYRRADPEFGAFKAGELMSDLSNALANEPLHVRQGKKIVEIVPHEINKGAAVAALLARERADAVLIAGDDATDESMFRLEGEDRFTVKVGEGDTRARYALRNPAALRRFLQSLLDAIPTTSA